MTQISQQLQETTQEQLNLTNESDQLKDATNKQSKVVKKYKPPAYLNSMNEIEKELNLKIIQNMNKRVNFLKNPRFIAKNPLVTYNLMDNSEVLTKSDDKKSPFRATPAFVFFSAYEVNQIYQQKLTITNVDRISRRMKYMPPGKEQFSISDISYPNDNTLIAPGMSVIFTINFKATSLANFYDELAILTDLNSFKVNIRAEKEEPQINLPANIKAQSCWVGDHTDIVYTITNRGGPAGFKFFRKEEDEQRSNSDVIIIENFQIQPRSFHLKKEESQKISVSFLPKKEGNITNYVILACDNQTTSKHILSGQSNQVELNLGALNNHKFKDQITIEKIYFLNSILNQTAKQELTVVNATSVKVSYHWGIFQTSSIKNHDIHVLENEKHFFEIKPDKGVFNPNEAIPFTFSFKGHEPVPYIEYACLIVDDLPIAAIKTLPKILEKSLNENRAIKNDDKFEGPGYFASNSAKQSIVLYEFELVGQVDFCKCTIEWPYYQFEEQLFIQEEYSAVFKVRNESKCKAQFEVEEIYGENNIIENQILNSRGEIEAKSEIEITIKVKSNQICKNQRLQFQMNIVHGHSICFEVFCPEFIGPIVQVNQSLINFKLIQSFSSKQLEIEVKNLTKIPAEILFRDPEKLNNNFDNLSEVDNFMMIGNNKLTFTPHHARLQAFERQIIKVKLEAQGPQTIQDTYIEMIVKDSEDQSFLEIFGEIQNIFVTLNITSMQLGTIYAGKTLAPQIFSITNHGNVQTKFEWDEIKQKKIRQENEIQVEDILSEAFIITFNPSKKTIQPKETVNIEMELTPLKGGPFEELMLCNVEGLDIPLGFQLQCNVEGLNVEYELLDVDDLTSVISATKIKKTLPSQSQQQLQTSQVQLTATKKTETIKDSTKTRLRGQKKKTLAQLTMEQSGSLKRGTNIIASSQQIYSVPLDTLEFLTCKINEPKQMRFTIRNTSGLQTTFKFDVEEYASINKKDNKDNVVLQSKTKLKQLQIKSNQSQQAGSNTKFLKLKDDKDQEPQQQLLTEEIEDTQNFSSVSGQALNAQRKLEKEQKFYLANNKGIAIVCEPDEGILEAYQEKIIKVTVFNDICGHFEDFIHSRIKGLDTYDIPVIINVTGSPLIVQPNQVGVRYIGDNPSLNAGTVMRKHKPISRQFKLANTGPKPIQFEWKLYDLGKVSKANKFFNLKIGNPSIGTKDKAKLYWEPIIPEEASNDIFEITDKENKPFTPGRVSVIQGRKSETYIVTFKSEVVGLYKYILIAKPSLVPEQVQKITEEMKDKDSEIDEKVEEESKNKNTGVLKSSLVLEPKTNKEQKDKNIGTLALNLYGETIQPKLTFEKIVLFLFFLIFVKRQEMVENKLLSFRNGQQETVGKNKNIFVQSTNQKRILSSQQKLMNHSIFLKQKQIPQWIITSFPLHYQHKKNAKLLLIQYKTPILNYLSSSKAQKSMIIRNDRYQNALGPSVLDFKIIHINNTSFLAIYLQNLTKIPAKWALKYVPYPTKKLQAPLTKTKLELEDELKTDDKSVFNFDITEGVIYGPTIPLNEVPIGPSLPTKLTNEDNKHSRKLPQKIMISFHPKKNILYKSKFKIIVEEGPAVSFILKGQGTYDEFLEK